jgi:hypothetical protein
VLCVCSNRFTITGKTYFPSMARIVLLCHGHMLFCREFLKRGLELLEVGRASQCVGVLLGQERASNCVGVFLGVR